MKKIALVLLIVLSLAPVARASSPAMPLTTLSVMGTWQFHDRSGAVVPANTFLIELLTASGTPLAWDYSETDGSFFLGPLSFPAEPVKVRIWTYAAYSGGTLNEPGLRTLLRLDRGLGGFLGFGGEQ